MSDDISIKPIVSIGAPQKLIPAYLVILKADKADKKACEFFIATRYEETPNCAKLVGFESDLPKDTIVSTYDQVISTTPATNFVEMLIPWNNIKCIRSLVYRHKQK